MLFLSTTTRNIYGLARVRRECVCTQTNDSWPQSDTSGKQISCAHNSLVDRVSTMMERRKYGTIIHTFMLLEHTSLKSATVNSMVKGTSTVHIPGYKLRKATFQS